MFAVTLKFGPSSRLTVTIHLGHQVPTAETYENFSLSFHSLIRTKRHRTIFLTRHFLQTYLSGQKSRKEDRFLARSDFLSAFPWLHNSVAPKHSWTIPVHKLYSWRHFPPDLTHRQLTTYYEHGPRQGSALHEFVLIT